MSGAVVIGFGNEWRGDDAAGPRVARRIEALALPNVRVLVAHQLTPELAEPLSAAERAFFVDASGEWSGEAIAAPIEPSEGGAFISHSLRPAQLLALSRVVYGRAPRAWIIEIEAREFSVDAPLSPVAAKRASEAVAVLECILKDSR